MAKFTKKPKVVDAEQWTGDNFAAIEKLVGADTATFEMSDGLIIKLQYNSRFITRGSYIVKENKEDEPLIFSEFNFNRFYSPKK